MNFKFKRCVVMAQKPGYVDPEMTYCKTPQEYADAISQKKNNPLYQWVETFIFHSRLEKQTSWSLTHV